MNALMPLLPRLPALCRDLLQVGTGLVLQSTLLLAVGLLAGRRLRRHGPAAAALVHKAAVLAALMGPLLAAMMGGRFQPLWTVALPPTHAAGKETLPPEITGQGTAPAPAARPVPTGGPGLGIPPARGTAPITRTAARSIRIPTGPGDAWKSAPALHPRASSRSAQATLLECLYLLLVSIWGVGATLLLARLTQAFRAMRRLRKTSLPAAGDALALLARLCESRGLAPPQLRVSPRVRSPVLTGLRRPAILLPAGYEAEFDAPALRAVLAHELAHLQRADCAWLLLARLACSVGWVQPLWWALARSLEESSEEACDREVVGRDATPDSYARCLVDLAERLILARIERATGVGIVPCRSSLERRVRSILSCPDHPLPPLTGRTRVAVTLSTLAIASAALMLVSVAAAPVDHPVKDPLADDARLAQQVRVTVEGLAVSDLLAQLSSKTGVSLAADAETGDDKVVLFGPVRPLRELLADLAALFNDRWERKQSASGTIRYRLIRTPSARQIEATFNRRTTEQMMLHLEQAVRGLEIKPEELERPENHVIQWQVSDRKRRFALMLYRLLSQAQREALFHDESLRIPFRALTPAQQAPVRAVFADVVAEEKAFSEEKAKQLPPELGLSPPLVSRPEDLENGEIRFRLMHIRGQFSLNLQFGKRLSPGIFITSFNTDGRWLVPAHGNPYTGDPLPLDAPVPGVKAVRAASGEKAWPDRLHKLSDGSSVTVVADYYRVRPITASFIEPRPPASGEAAAALDALCEPDGYLWWVRGQTVLVRKRDWFVQRRYEVPDRWLLDVIDRARQAPLTCADVSRVLDLTDDQILGLGLFRDGPGEFVVEGEGQFTRAEQIGGLREYLAIVNAAPRNSRGQIQNTEPDSSSSTTVTRYTLKYDTMTPLQRRLVPGFLAAQDYPVSPADPERFSLFLFRIGQTPITTPAGYKHVPFRLAWDSGEKEKISLGYVLDLPASLPGDRRDRTRIEVLPEGKSG